jgi:hypothetical protein
MFSICVGSHNAGVIDADVHKELVQLDVLLGKGFNQVMKLKPGDGKHGLAVELGVIEPVEKVDASGPGGRETHTEFAGPFCVSTGAERRCFLVPDLNETDSILARSQRFNDAVNTVPRNAEDGVDAPIDKGLDQNIAGVGGGHYTPPQESAPLPCRPTIQSRHPFRHW